MELQNFLRKEGVKALEDTYKIKVRTHCRYPNLHQFKYNQIESPMGTAIAQQCRGIILDADNNWEVVCRTFNKFFNHGENHSVQIDWESARVYEKLDGSLMQLYWYDNQWNVATSGTPDAECQVNLGNITFKDLFWKTWNDLGYRLPDETDYCHAFELMTPFNRVVVRHMEPRLVLIGTRNVKYGYEMVPYVTDEGWEVVKQYDLKDLHSILNTLEDIDPYNQEGYVVCDKYFDRVKIKSPKYVAIHHVIGSMSTRNMLEIVRAAEGDEFLAHFPEWKEFHNELKEKFESLVKEAEGVWNTHKGIQGQKSFAMAVKHLPYSGALFNMRNGKTPSIRQFFKDMRVQNLENLLGLKQSVAMDPGERQ